MTREQAPDARAVLVHSLRREASMKKDKQLAMEMKNKALGEGAAGRHAVQHRPTCLFRPGLVGPGNCRQRAALRLSSAPLRLQWLRTSARRPSRS